MKHAKACIISVIVQQYASKAYGMLFFYSRWKIVHISDAPWKLCSVWQQQLFYLCDSDKAPVRRKSTHV